MLNDIDFDKIDINGSIPEDETNRQYYYIAKCREYVSNLKKEIGRDLTCSVKTFGCQMNARDSEKILGMLILMGYTPIESEDADLVLYNTCTVRENANQKVYGHLGYLKNKKKHNPYMMIGLCGCMMQEPQVIETIRSKYRFVDVVFGTHNIFKFAEILYTRFESGSMVIDIWDRTDEIVEDLPSERKYSFKAGVNIMFGCNNFCSFCIVPYVRGRERSRNPRDIIREIEMLVADGVTEVTLLGQNVNSYGKTLDDKMTFAELLELVCQVDGLKRVRFMTSHPKDLPDELIEVMAKEPKICKHFHLPLQSGSDRLLTEMNRHYDKATYLELVDKLRAAMPDISITTDIIVGYPGETEEDFNDTLEVVRKAQYDAAFTFIYSKRSGTAAAKKEQLDKDVVKERFDRLLKEVQTIAADRTNRFEGEVKEVLVESVNDHEEGMVTGRMDNNLLVHFKGDESLIGSYVDVKLTDGKDFYYIGEAVKER